MPPSPTVDIYRTRLFLITPPGYEADTFAPHLKRVLEAGDVASLLITQPHEGSYQEAAEQLVPIAQKHGVAALVHNDSQIMGRMQADGLHLDGAISDVVETVKGHAGREIMGVAAGTTRHDAMIMGEGPVDYLFFGRLDGDTMADIFPKTYKLAEWWSALFEVPAVVMGGKTMASVKQAGDAGIDFIALQSAIWDAENPAHAIVEANALLDAAFKNRETAAHA